MQKLDTMSEPERRRLIGGASRPNTLNDPG
jgi:hypothetical protein